MRIVVAVTGASGIVVAKRLLENLRKHETHLIVSDGAVETARHEKVDIRELKKLASHVHDESDLSASVSSSSNRIDAMVVVPCSMKTLSSMANGFSDNLITRAAENCMKMGWKLVVCPRDTPLSLAAIENMHKLKIAGALIVPPNMAYYYGPKTVDDVTSFFSGKILDALGVDHSLYRKWKSK